MICQQSPNKITEYEQNRLFTELLRISSDMDRFDVEKIEKLLQRGVRPTLLYTALGHRHYKLAEALITLFNYDIDTIDENRNTALSLFAKSYAKEEILLKFIEFLLDHGANPSQIVCKDVTPVELAKTDNIRGLLLTSPKAGKACTKWCLAQIIWLRISK